MIGINGKSSELHAAMGLSVLPSMPDIFSARKKIVGHYQHALRNLRVQFQQENPLGAINHSYFLILFEAEEQLLRSVGELNRYQVFPRRYFYPSLDTLNYVTGNNCPISQDISKRILCLPLYPDLATEEVDMIARLLLRAQNN